MSLLQIVTLLFEALLGLFSAYTAYSLFSWTPPSIAKAREALHYPRWYWLLAGCMATIGALGLLVGLFLPVIGALRQIAIAGEFAAAIRMMQKPRRWMPLPTPCAEPTRRAAHLLWLPWPNPRPCARTDPRSRPGTASPLRSRLPWYPSPICYWVLLPEIHD